MTENTTTGSRESEQTTHPESIDWNRFWAEADEADRNGATPSTHHAIDLLDAFFEEKGVPASFADVGCGPGDVAFAMADSHPETSVVGFDAAETILEENRRRAQGHENLSFETTVLPDFDPDRQFGVVFCFGTMAYVEQSARALQRLYGAVEPGGYLVLSYINERGRNHFQQVVDQPEQRLAEDDGFEPERFARRFRLVLDGKSTLSYRSIHEAVGTWPRSFWEFTEKPDEPWAWNHVPLVWVPKQ